MKHTKIIATHGPAIQTEDDIIALYDTGVNVIWFNFSHADYDTVRKTLEIMRKNNRSGRTALSMLMDTKWPEIRTGDLENKQSYSRGDIFFIYDDANKYSEDGTSLFCDYPYLSEDIEPGNTVEIDSGLFQVRVKQTFDGYIEVEALNDATIWSRRHINLPGIELKMPGITQKDKEDIAFAVEESMDFIAQSFVRSGENVQELRKYLDSLWGEHIKIIAKVENEQGIENLDDIVAQSDGVMVARWDLWIEVPIEHLPTLQAQIIDKTLAAGKFSIIATHLLESMIENPFPTRAEVSDIYNCVMQRTDATMLSGETAAGKYPIESVTVMRDTILEAEKHLVLEHRDFSNKGLTKRDIEKKALIRSAIYAGEELAVEGIFIFTKSWKLARLASSFRPNLPIYAFTMHLSSVAYMNTLYGVNPYIIENWDAKFIQNIYTAIDILKANHTLTPWDRVMVVNDIQKGVQEIPVVELMEIT